GGRRRLLTTAQSTCISGVGKGGEVVVAPLYGVAFSPTLRRSADVEEKVTERMIIRGTPQHCFAVLTAFEAYPEWAADIKSVSIDRRDDRGRAAQVTFRAAAFGRSTSYTLRYDY